MKTVVQREQQPFCTAGWGAALPKMIITVLLVCTLFGSVGWGRNGLAEVENAAAGVDRVWIGEYDVLNDGIDGSIPVEWYVVDWNDTSVTLLSRYAVAERRMNRIPETDRQKTELLQWLQNEFSRQAFQDEEREAITSIGLYSAGSSEQNVIEEHPEIMRLEQTEDFHQEKWWLESYPQIWLPLGCEGGATPDCVIPETMWPVYEKLLAGELRKDGGGMGYFLGALYDVVAEDEQDPKGYTVFEYGYPVISELAVRPRLVVTRDYFFGLKGIAIPDAQSPDAIVMDGVVEALVNPGNDVNGMLSSIFGDLSSVPCEISREKDDEGQKEVVRVKCDSAFPWNQHRVTGFTLTATKQKKQEGTVEHRISIRIEDSSPENVYTVSKMYGDTMEYHKTSENWKYVIQRYPYQEQKHGAAMDISRNDSLFGENASITLSLYVACPEYDFEAFFQ